MKHLDRATTFPEAVAFLTWVKRSIADLDMHPSNFLLDENVPGSINRLNRIIAKPDTLRFSVARRLHREIIEKAHARGVELLPLQLDVLQDEQDQ